MKKIKDFFKMLYEYKECPKGFDFLQTYFLVFFGGCVAGWIYEELFYYFVEDKLLNSGFFYGPYLPVYGFGCLFILLCTARFKKHPTAIFVGSMLVTGILEYITGYVMYAIWEKRWWDYRGLFLNIDGFVCLRSVLTFAVGGLAAVYFMDPFIRKFAVENPKKKTIVCAVLFVIMAIDVTCTFLFREHVPMI